MGNDLSCRGDISCLQCIIEKPENTLPRCCESCKSDVVQYCNRFFVFEESGTQSGGAMPRNRCEKCDHSFRDHFGIPCTVLEEDHSSPRTHDGLIEKGPHPRFDSLYQHFLDRTNDNKQSSEEQKRFLIDIIKKVRKNKCFDAIGSPHVAFSQPLFSAVYQTIKAFECDNLFKSLSLNPSHCELPICAPIQRCYLEVITFLMGHMQHVDILTAYTKTFEPALNNNDYLAKLVELMLLMMPQEAKNTSKLMGQVLEYKPDTGNSYDVLTVLIDNIDRAVELVVKLRQLLLDDGSTDNSLLLCSEPTEIVETEENDSQKNLAKIRCGQDIITSDLNWIRHVEMNVARFKLFLCRMINHNREGLYGAVSGVLPSLGDSAAAEDCHRQLVTACGYPYSPSLIHGAILHRGEQIGAGKFGKVFKVHCGPVNLALKEIDLTVHDQETIESELNAFYPTFLFQRIGPVPDGGTNYSAMGRMFLEECSRQVPLITWTNRNTKKFYVLMLLYPESLKQFIKNRDSPTDQPSLEFTKRRQIENAYIMYQICDQLVRLHTYGLIHCDLNTGNFLVYNYDAALDVVISDFGLSTVNFTENETEDKNENENYYPVTGCSSFSSGEPPSGSGSTARPSHDMEMIKAIYTCLRGNTTSATTNEDENEFVRFLDSKPNAEPARDASLKLLSTLCRPLTKVELKEFPRKLRQLVKE